MGDEEMRARYRHVRIRSWTAICTQCNRGLTWSSSERVVSMNMSARGQGPQSPLVVRGSPVAFSMLRARFMVEKSVSTLSECLKRPQVMKEFFGGFFWYSNGSGLTVKHQLGQVGHFPGWWVGLAAIPTRFSSERKRRQQ
jgi:hypothetical protein